MSKPFFSVVIPSYNRAATISRALDSCAAQTFRDFEIVIVDDDKSSDDMAGAVAPYRDRHDINLVLDHEGKAGAARNTGVRLARGRYIAFLDADDQWLPNKLELCHARLQAEPDTLFYSQNVVDRGVGKYWVKPARALGPDESIYDYLFYHKGWIHPTSIVVDVETARRYPFTEEIAFVDDTKLAVDMWRAGVPMKMIEVPTTVYYDPYEPGRLSQASAFEPEKNPEQFAFFEWMESLRGDMSETAWLGYRAGWRSRLIARAKPLPALKDVWAASLEGPAGLKRSVMQTVQTFTPHVYRRLCDLAVRVKGFDSVERAVASVARDLPTNGPDTAPAETATPAAEVVGTVARR